MTLFSASFMSQKFGRALGTTSIAGEKGEVEIHYLESERAPTRFVFTVRGFLAACGNSNRVGELALRSAISYVHGHPDCSADSPIELEHAVRMWIGDFLIPEILPNSNEEAREADRRQDARTAALITQGMRLQATLGFEKAIRYLSAEGVSDSLARLVLSIRFERRKRARREATAPAASPEAGMPGMRRRHAGRA